LKHSKCICLIRRYLRKRQYRNLYCAKLERFEFCHLTGITSAEDEEKSRATTEGDVMFEDKKAVAKLFYSVSGSPTMFQDQVVKNVKFWTCMLSVLVQ